MHADIIPMLGRTEENDDGLTLAVVPLELRTEYLLNTGRCSGACRYANLLGDEVPRKISRVECRLSDLNGPKGGRIKREWGQNRSLIEWKCGRSINAVCK